MLLTVGGGKLVRMVFVSQDPASVIISATVRMFESSLGVVGAESAVQMSFSILIFLLDPTSHLPDLLSISMP